MTDIYFADLVSETSQSSGIENFILGGAIPGHQSFIKTVPQNRLFYYSIVNEANPDEWEIGIGRLDHDGLLIRDPITTMNNNDMVDFSDGPKTVKLTVSADWFSTQTAIKPDAHSHDIRDIGRMSDDYLDAWGEVQWCRYKFKAGGKRWHLGLIAQDIYQVFAKHGIDAFELGLCCFDKWDDEYQENPEGERNLIRVAGEKWGLRYDECFALEAAWQRRELSLMKVRLDRLMKAE